METPKKFIVVYTAVFFITLFGLLWQLISSSQESRRELKVLNEADNFCFSPTNPYGLPQCLHQLQRCVDSNQWKVVELNAWCEMNRGRPPHEYYWRGYEIQRPGR